MKYHRLNHSEVLLASDFFADFFGAGAFGADFTSGGAGAGADAPPFTRSLSLPIILNQ
tara:strand:- start:28 stop:201 length:174 start_codon:yes stop_codon:yes gene_type:complete